jgi:hypothetical protein
LNKLSKTSISKIGLFTKEFLLEKEEFLEEVEKLVFSFNSIFF